VAQGDLKRSSLNEFLEVVEDASALLVANLKRSAELVQSFQQVAVASFSQQGHTMGGVCIGDSWGVRCRES